MKKIRFERWRTRNAYRPFEQKILNEFYCFISYSVGLDDSVFVVLALIGHCIIVLIENVPRPVYIWYCSQICSNINRGNSFAVVRVGDVRTCAKVEWRAVRRRETKCCTLDETGHCNTSCDVLVRATKVVEWHSGEMTRSRSHRSVI